MWLECKACGSMTGLAVQVNWRAMLDRPKTELAIVVIHYACPLRETGPRAESKMTSYRYEVDNHKPSKNDEPEGKLTTLYKYRPGEYWPKE